MGEARLPADRRDAAQDIASELANLAAQLGTLKGEAMNWLTAPRPGGTAAQNVSERVSWWRRMFG